MGVIFCYGAGLGVREGMFSKLGNSRKGNVAGQRCSGDCAKRG